jgi:hypothetical protein
MLRELNNQEKENTEKGITILDRQISEQKEIKEFAERKIELMRKQWEFEDWSRPIERKKTELSASRTIKEAEADLLRIEETRKILIDQLNNGVEIKEPTSIG